MVLRLASQSFPDPAYQAGMICMYDAMHDMMYDDAMYDAMYDDAMDGTMYDAMQCMMFTTLPRSRSSRPSKWGVSCQLTSSPNWRKLSKKGVSG